MGMHIGDKNIQEPQVGALDLTTATPQITKEDTKLEKLHPRDQVAEAQNTKPSILNSEAVKFAQMACGFSMMGLGFIGAAVLFPITIPMGLLGAGLGLALGKAIGREKSGMLVGSAIGTLLFSGLAFAGAKLVENALKPNDGKIKEPVGKSQLELPKLSTKELKQKINDTQANMEKLSGDPNATIYKKLQSELVNLSMKLAESQFQDRIDSFRNMSKQGNNSEIEIQEKKIQLRGELKENKLGKEFENSALAQLKEFDADFAKGEITKTENLNKAFTIMMEKNDISINFFQFIKDLPKNSEMNAKIPDPTGTINEIKELQNKAIRTLEDKNIDVTTRTVSIFSDRGHLRSDAQFFILDDLKTILSNEKTSEQKKEVNSSIDIIKRHLTHQLAEGKGVSTEEEVIKAYQTIKNFAAEAVNAGANSDNVSNDVSPNDELGAAVKAEIDRLLKTEVSQPNPVNLPKAPSFQEQLSEVKSKLAKLVIEKQSLKLHIIELEKINSPNKEELSDITLSRANLINLIDQDLKLNLDLIGLSRRNETTKYLSR